MGVVLLVRHGQASFGADDYDVLSETGRRAEPGARAGPGRRRASRRAPSCTGRCGGSATRRPRWSRRRLVGRARARRGVERVRPRRRRRPGSRRAADRHATGGRSSGSSRRPRRGGRAASTTTSTTSRGRRSSAGSRDGARPGVRARRASRSSVSSGGPIAAACATLVDPRRPPERCRGCGTRSTPYRERRRSPGCSRARPAGGCCRSTSTPTCPASWSPTATALGRAGCSLVTRRPLVCRRRRSGLPERWTACYMSRIQPAADQLRADPLGAARPSVGVRRVSPWRHERSNGLGPDRRRAGQQPARPTDAGDGRRARRGARATGSAPACWCSRPATRTPTSTSGSARRAARCRRCWRSAT